MVILLFIYWHTFYNRGLPMTAYILIPKIEYLFKIIFESFKYKQKLYNIRGVTYFTINYLRIANIFHCQI